MKVTLKDGTEVELVSRETYQLPEGELYVECTLELYNGYKVKARSASAADVTEFAEQDGALRYMAKATANVKAGELHAYALHVESQSK